MENLESRLREIDAEVQRHSDTLLSKSETSREDQSRWYLSQVESECSHTLRPLDYESDKSEVANQVPGTCQWFFAHSKYQT